MHTDVHKTEITRRSLLSLLGWGAFFTTLAISVPASIRFLFPRVLFEKPSTFKIGAPDDFRINGNSEHQVYETWKAEHSVWLVKEKNRIYAVHAKCTHLGCTPNWFPDEGVFKCPCHGSQFNRSGVNFAGPAPRPLDRLKISIGKDGMLVVDKSRVYTFNEFDKQGTYVEV
ncbi:MAG: ubiquinol-cytochrome c reductase iron-sulfur subunit [Nitrospirae bacterium]|nr:ubiquinol-cytochrome c reductase iron-sulfur subunit [Nitrospirota bacterium]